MSAPRWQAVPAGKPTGVAVKYSAVTQIENGKRIPPRRRVSSTVGAAWRPANADLHRPVYRAHAPPA